MDVVRRSDIDAWRGSFLRVLRRAPFST
jgi:hypothetical protein